jgi:hypothetical protein
MVEVRTCNACWRDSDTFDTFAEGDEHGMEHRGCWFCDDCYDALVDATCTCCGWMPDNAWETVIRDGGDAYCEECDPFEQDDDDDPCHGSTY